MSKLFEMSETKYGVPYQEILKITNDIDKQKQGHIYVLLSETTFLFLSDKTKIGDLFRALYNNTLDTVIKNIYKEADIHLDIMDITNIIPIEKEIPLLNEALDIEIKDTFIFSNNGDILTVFNGLMEPIDIPTFNNEYGVNFSDLKNLN